MFLSDGFVDRRADAAQGKHVSLVSVLRTEEGKGYVEGRAFFTFLALRPPIRLGWTGLFRFWKVHRLCDDGGWGAGERGLRAFNWS